MGAKGRRFITKFLLPSLDHERFGELLKWLKPQEGIFQLQWSHKACQEWTVGHVDVFVEWDKLQGHYKPDSKEYYSKCKQRFRAVLYKLMKDNVIRKMCSNDKRIKIYCLVHMCETVTVPGAEPFKSKENLPDNGGLSVLITTPSINNGEENSWSVYEESSYESDKFRNLNYLQKSSPSYDISKEHCYANAEMRVNLLDDLNFTIQDETSAFPDTDSEYFSNQVFCSYNDEISMYCSTLSDKEACTKSIQPYSQYSENKWPTVGLSTNQPAYSEVEENLESMYFVDPVNANKSLLLQ